MRMTIASLKIPITFGLCSSHGMICLHPFLRRTDESIPVEQEVRGQKQIAYYQVGERIFFNSKHFLLKWANLKEINCEYFNDFLHLLKSQAFKAIPSLACGGTEMERGEGNEIT